MTVSAAVDLAALFDQGLAALACPLDVHARRTLLDYVALLAKWNGTFNLTAIREPARMITHHLLDSLAVLPALDALVEGSAPVTVLDVGSGAGLPGIPIAVARPAWRVVMLEPVHKKSAFLTQALADLRLRNAQAVTQRAEAYRGEAPANIAISRAFSDLASFATAAQAHVASDGVIVAMKGVHPHEELRELPAEFEVTATLPLRVPGVDAARHLIVMRRRQAQ